VLYVTNHDAVPIVAQIEAFDRHQDDSGDALARSDALMVSPPLARLMPEQRQTVRLALPASAGADERSYRLVVSEPPTRKPSRSRACACCSGFPSPYSRKPRRRRARRR
jgi:fimbrial chaperone protein